mgnify:CR=1 FL=1
MPFRAFYEHCSFFHLSYWYYLKGRILVVFEIKVIMLLNISLRELKEPLPVASRWNEIKLQNIMHNMHIIGTRVDRITKHGRFTEKHTATFLRLLNYRWLYYRLNFIECQLFPFEIRSFGCNSRTKPIIVRIMYLPRMRIWICFNGVLIDSRNTHVCSLSTVYARLNSLQVIRTSL